MFALIITEKGGASERREFTHSEVTIGRIQSNDVVLPKSNISKRHAKLVDDGIQLIVEDAGSTNGTYVNGKRIEGPQRVGPGDRVFIGDFIIEAEQSGAAAADDGYEQVSAAEFEDDWGDDATEARPEMASTPPAAAEAPPPIPQAAPSAPPAAATQAAVPSGPPPAEPAVPPPVIAAPSGRVNMVSSVSGDLTPAQAVMAVPESITDPLEAIHCAFRLASRQRVSAIMSANAQDSQAITEEVLSACVDDLVALGRVPSAHADALFQKAFEDAYRLGGLDKLMSDESISEVMVNGAKQVYVEKHGQIQEVASPFQNDESLLGIIERICLPIGRKLDEDHPMVDARLEDGSRVNAVIPPLSLNGPTLTIRRFARIPLTIDDLVVKGTLTPEMAEFLEVCVRARKNMVISGGTGAGKTTTLNVLSSFIPDTERIVTVEDAAEIQLDQRHVVRMETRPPTFDGPRQVTIRDLIRNSLRMRPDRIIVGECRGGEALDMLQAMNTGHDGSLTTLHANTPRDALARMETMVLMAGMDLPVRAIREQIASAADVIVQQTRLSDGSRRITSICEVTGMEGDIIAMQELFSFKQTGLDSAGKMQGAFVAAGVRPRFYDELKARGFDLNLGIFSA